MASDIEKTRIIKIIALDFDGVITNLDINWNDAIRQASAIIGYDAKSLLLFYENNFGTSIFQKVSTEMEKIELEAIKKAQVLPFVKETLQKFAEKKIDVYIVSMQSFRVVNEFLNQHGLNSYFQGIITREKCPCKKAQVEYLIKETSISPEDVLFIDDSKRNINLCSKLGVICFHFQRNSFSFLRKNPQDAAKETWDNVLNLVNSAKNFP
jgi:HAD superfamily hydrolase (TIGR01509 family)